MPSHNRRCALYVLRKRITIDVRPARSRQHPDASFDKIRERNVVSDRLHGSSGDSDELIRIQLIKDDFRVGFFKPHPSSPQSTVQFPARLNIRKHADHMLFDGR